MTDNCRCVDDVANALGCSYPRGEQIFRAVIQSLRDGLDVDEADSIEASLPPEVRAMWPRRAGVHPGLADLGDEGFLGRVHRLAASSNHEETKRMVHVVMTAMMTAMAIPGDDRRAAWPALTRLPRASKIVWMKLFRAACFPVELYT